MKKLVFKAGSAPGISSMLRRWKSGPTVLFYHGVEEKIVDPRIQTLHLELAAFEKQIGYLRKHFDIVSIDDLCDGVTGGKKLPPSMVVLTFDDGYRNNLDVVAPYLASLGVPFSVFVSTRHIDEGLRFPTYYLRTSVLNTRERRVTVLDHEFDVGTDDQKRQSMAAISGFLKSSALPTVSRVVEDLRKLLPDDQWDELNERFSSDAPMDWTQVRALRDTGAVIGSHCHDHILLHEGQELEEIDRQLRLSKTLLDEHVGDCKYIAYPNGTTSDIFPAALCRVAQHGYRAGMTTVNGEVEQGISPLLLPRIGTSTTDFDQFRFIVNTSFRNNRANRTWCQNLISA